MSHHNNQKHQDYSTFSMVLSFLTIFFAFVDLDDSPPLFYSPIISKYINEQTAAAYQDPLFIHPHGHRIGQLRRISSCHLQRALLLEL